MKKIFYFLLILPFVLIQPVSAQGESNSEQKHVIVAKELDPRALVLMDYFAKYNSPLENHSQDFIDAADEYELDWKLVPSIAGVESTFGKFTPGGFNGWGWGVYGDQALGFSSWRHGIFTVSKGLKENYINRGLTDPYSMNRIYATSPTWGSRVSYFMNDLDQFAKSHRALSENSLPVKYSDAELKTAGISAKLAFRN